MTSLPFAQLDQQNLRARRSPPPPASPLDEVVKAAAEKLLTLKMTRLSLEPDNADVKNILGDIETLTVIFDEVIEAVAKYAGAHFGLTAKQLSDCGHNQVRGALEGNLTFIIEEAMRDIHESRMAQLDRDFGDRQ